MFDKVENAALFVPVACADVHGRDGEQSDINITDRLLQHHEDIQRSEGSQSSHGPRARRPGGYPCVVRPTGRTHVRGSRRQGHNRRISGTAADH